MTHSIRIDQDVEMKTRDGVILRADVIRPDIKTKVPALICRTPYNKAVKWQNRLVPVLAAAKEGFAVVIQDVRGRFTSDGDWDIMSWTSTEPPDGYDAIEWLASEPWCNGNVGMFGNSYEGGNQYSAASAEPPGLKAIAPSGAASGPDIVLKASMMLEFVHIGWMAWMAQDALSRKLAEGEAGPEHAKVLEEFAKDPAAACRALPIKDLPVFRIPGMPSYAGLLEILREGAPAWDPEAHKAVHAPALITSGWYDLGVGTDQFRALRSTAASEHARRETKTILGPWDHSTYEPTLGERSWGYMSSPIQLADVTVAHFNFFDRHLRGGDAPELPNVRYFVMGSRAWKEADDWPVPGSEERRLYFRSDGRANSTDGDGRLSLDMPSNREAPDTFTYDPRNPVPSFGGRYFPSGITSVSGPFDQRRIESRPDVLVYTSEPLQSELEVAGDVEVRMFVSSSARDTDFHVKLCDVDRAGISHNIADGFIRTRYRAGMDRTDWLERNNVYELRIDLGPTANLFREGHRIRVQVTSSSFPYWDRNMNTATPLGEHTDVVVAEQTVFHSAEHPSHVLFRTTSG